MQSARPAHRLFWSQRGISEKRQMAISEQHGNICSMFRGNVTGVAKTQKVVDVSIVQKGVAPSFAKDRFCQGRRKVWRLCGIRRRCERVIARETSSSTNPIAHFPFGHMC